MSLLVFASVPCATLSSTSSFSFPRNILKQHMPSDDKTRDEGERRSTSGLMLVTASWVLANCRGIRLSDGLKLRNQLKLLIDVFIQLAIIEFAFSIKVCLPTFTRALNFKVLWKKKLFLEIIFFGEKFFFALAREFNFGNQEFPSIFRFSPYYPSNEKGFHGNIVQILKFLVKRTEFLCQMLAASDFRLFAFSTA